MGELGGLGRGGGGEGLFGENYRLGFEAGVCEIIWLRTCLADLQLGLLEVFSFFLLLLETGSHRCSRTPLWWRFCIRYSWGYGPRKVDIVWTIAEHAVRYV